ncbi:MAG: methyltransferase, partial [Desulfobacteraceae bacterium]|nr:methyltransferase [Desulfobacteraceae bacterium]
SCRRTAPANLVLGMLPDALTDRGDLPDSGFLASHLLKAGFKSVQTKTVSMPSNEMELDIARKA